MDIYISISIRYPMRTNQIFYKLIIVQYSTDKNYKILGLVLSSDLTRLEKSYKNPNSWETSYVLLANASRSASSMVKSLRIISTSRSGRWFLNIAAVLTTAVEITVEEESSRLECACQAKSSDWSWIFSFSLEALSFSSAVVIWILAFWITATSRAADLLVSLSSVAVREALVDSSSWVNSTLTSLEFRRVCSVAWLAVFYLAKDRSTTDRAIFSLDSASCAAASCVVNATI
jgi:hypothetical protein